MNGTLPVVESFHSLQGEGAHAGRSAFFIRLAGCSVGCPWCDTKHSWTSQGHQEIPLQQLARETATAASNGAAFVVLTGGEPLHHNIDLLCADLRRATANLPEGPLPIHLETSGVNPLSGAPDWITLSPKRHAPPHPQLLAACQELKVVVHSEADLQFAESMAAEALTARTKAQTCSNPTTDQPARELLLMLQPGWDNREAQRLAINYVQAHPNWRLSVQTHKWLMVR